MEPAEGFLSTLWNFICFLPYFIGLLLLGTTKGIIFCPLICLIMTFGNSAIILGLWPVHIIWTDYCVLSSKLIGPILKILLCIGITILLVVWPAIGIVGSIISGAAYGFLVPIFATFEAVGEGKTNELFHCFCDGTWSTVKESFTIVRDFGDFCYHSYFSFMDDLERQGLTNGKYYEIRLLHLPGALIAGVLGCIVDFPVITVIALCKSPFMLFKGWHRLFHDLIGREGPFLDTMCVPFAGLAIILWPLAVIGAVLGSMVSSMFLGAYASVVVYQESSFWMGLCFIVASLSIYDEYSNDILDMPEGSCFPRPQYRKNPELSTTPSRTTSFTRPSSFRNHPSRTNSLKNPMIELKPLSFFDSLFKDCQQHGESLVSDGLVTLQDIEDAKSGKGSKVISTGLLAYSLLQTLLRSAKTDSTGLLLSDEFTEITTSNRAKDTFFDWFLNPLLIIKDQIKAQNLSDEEEDYFCKLVLLIGDPARLKNSNIGPPPELERRRAELDALARRLQGITKSMSRYPTFRRRFDYLVKMLNEDVGRGSRPTGEIQTIQRSKSAFARIFSQKSFKSNKSNHDSDQESKQVFTRDVEIA